MPRLDPPDRHDAAYVWRNTHVTGAIDIHELDLSTDGRVYFVNTAFSCLCVTDHEHSFVSMWRPVFIPGYASEDRCHLNGLGLVAGTPRYATALGATATSPMAGVPTSETGAS